MGIRSLNLINQLSALAGQYLWIPLMFLVMHVNKVCSVEQLKTVYREEFGQVMGLKKLWNLDIIRQHIGELTDQKNAIKAKYQFIQLQIFNGTVSIWRLFLDGHFVPYSGKEKVHKRYCTQRDLMMPGRTEFFAHARCVDLAETGEAPFNVIDNESKNRWDLMEMLFWNTRKKLATGRYIPGYRTSGIYCRFWMPSPVREVG